MTTPDPVEARTRGLTAGTWWLLAGLAATTSLGLGWDWYYHPYFGTQIFLTPGSSVVLADGTIDFTPGTLMIFPTLDYDSGVIPGYASHARVLLAAAALLFVLAVQRGSRSLARAGLALGVVAPVLSGGSDSGLGDLPRRPGVRSHGAAGHGSAGGPNMTEPPSYICA